jgi:hypothetical protein
MFPGATTDFSSMEKLLANLYFINNVPGVNLNGSTLGVN